MEVVLSSGRFGDEVPGAPFHNEEIREWSHVDRLTGMLERARVETGRWKTLNEGAARTYGKVIDSRERNSADGSVVQRARRQVEVFQSEAPGRSVQVVRASQWSSSRVTDSTTTSPSAIHSLSQKKKIGSSDRSTGLSSRLRRISPSSSLCRDEDISERLSTLLGSFANHTSSSTVPLRRIDSKYATRMPINLPLSRRSNSNENLPTQNESSLSDRLLSSKSLRDSNDRIAQKIEDTLSSQIKDSSSEESRHVVHEIDVKREETNYDDELLRDLDETNENLQTLIAIDECRASTNKAAIQLLPSSKANTTVVNLINNNKISDTTDITEIKRLSWILPSSAGKKEEEEEEEITRVETEEEETRRDSKLIEESAMSSNPTKSVKRVGFCKTEIHFAADSGKVNIVETDGKPPPTNKFRRRRRNSLNSCSNGKHFIGIENIPVIDKKISNDIFNDDKKTNIDHLQRGHTTTVNLGFNINSKNQRSNKDTEEPSESIVESMEKNSKNKLHLMAGIETENEASREVCNVVCHDSDNNQVLLKVVTTHEPTIARVENDHLRKKIKASNLTDAPPSLLKKEKRSSKCFTLSGKKLQSQKEHTYVNVFTGSKRAPIYENYKMLDSAPTIDEKIVSNLSLDLNNSSKEKKDVSNSQNLASKSRLLESPKLERIKVASISGNSTSANGKLYINKKTRDKTKDSKISREEISSDGNPSNFPSRGRSSKLVTKNNSKSTSLSSSETSGRLNGANNTNILSKSTRNSTTGKTSTNKEDIVKKQKPVEVVYQTAVYNMKNEKLKKPIKGKEAKGPRYFNELICGAKIKKPSDSKSGKTTSTSQHGAKTALQPIKHWK